MEKKPCTCRGPGVVANLAPAARGKSAAAKAPTAKAPAARARSVAQAARAKLAVPAAKGKTKQPVHEYIAMVESTQTCLNETPDGHINLNMFK